MSESTVQTGPVAQPQFKTCRVCNRRQGITNFHNRKGAKDGHNNTCRTCKVEQVAAWRKANPEKYASQIAWNQTKAERSRYNGWLRRFGLTREEVDAMIATQNGLCAICGSPPTGRCVALAIDHDHETGQIRDLLCDRCNTTIGKAHDDPALLRAMADYLDRHSS